MQITHGTPLMKKLCIAIGMSLLSGHAMASGIDCKSIYTKPPMDRHLLAQYQIKKLPTEVQKIMLRDYNSTVQGCRMPATSVLVAYSPYEDGLVVFMCGNVDAAAYRADRVALQDAIAGKIFFQTPSPTLDGDCDRKSFYQPDTLPPGAVVVQRPSKQHPHATTIINYTLPDASTPQDTEPRN
jgi:hypothetical protein